jgi:tRNA pseudouridine55 synthase
VGRRTKDSGIDGLLVIDKPSGMTSTDVVNRVRRITGQRRCGHSGTLDPGATGVLLVALGQCTKLLQYLSAHTKSYDAELVLGVTTNTLDNEGQVTATFDMAGVTLQQVQASASALVGDIMQVPPMVSAVQIDGKRLHEYEREGIEVERVARPVSVYRYDVASTDDPLVFKISVDCSTGTYVRVLAADVGEALGGGAHIRYLRRSAIGPFTADAGLVLSDELATAVPLTAIEMMGHLPIVEVDLTLGGQILLGSVLPRSAFPTVPADASLWQVVLVGQLIALYEPFRESECKPAVVLNRGQLGSE